MIYIMLRIGGEPSVFVSHSQHDKNEISFFTKVAAKEGIKCFFMEWEDLEGKYSSERIRNIIKSNLVENVQVLVVLLGDNVLKSPSPEYTQNWISFEVGVASDSKKFVWVLEEKNKPINYPLPFVSDYYQYQLESINDIRSISKIIKWQLQYPYTKNPDDDKVKQKCPYQNCNAEFRLWNRYNDQISCPVCRQVIVWNK